MTTPSAIFLSTEEGDEELDNHSYRPADWSDALGFVDDLITTGHEYRTLVIDTVDWLHDILEDAVCKKHSWNDIEEPGYGRGPAACVVEWRTLLARLEQLRSKRSMNVLLLGHAEIKRFSNPNGEDYDRFQLKLPARCAALIREWSKFVLFAEFETQTFGTKNKKKGLQTGRRIAHTERRAAFDAKNRYGLPAVLPLSYLAFEEARKKALEDVSAEFEQRIAAMDTQQRAKVEAWLEKQPNRRVAIAQAVNQLRAKEGATT